MARRTTKPTPEVVEAEIVDVADIPLEQMMGAPTVTIPFDMLTTTFTNLNNLTKENFELKGMVKQQNEFIQRLSSELDDIKGKLDAGLSN